MGGDEKSLLTLARIGEMLAGKAPLEETLKGWLPKMAQLVGIDSAGVYLLKENSAAMELVHTYGVSRRFAAAVALARIDRGIVGRVFKSGKPVALYRFSPRYSLAASIKKEGLKAIAYVPIRAAGGPRGILCLSNHKPYKFRRATLRLSLALGRQIGSAWEKDVVSAQAERRRSQLESLSRLSLEFGSVRSVTQLFRLVARRAKTLLKADWCGIRILEGDQLSLVAEADGRLGLKPSLRIGESLAGRVIRFKRPLAVPDMGTVSFQIPNHRAAVMRRGYKAFLGVPLKYRGQGMGVISVMERNAKEFPAEEISLLQGIAEQVGLAFHKLKLLEEKEILLRAQSDFLNTVSHDLRTPLNVIVGNIDLIREGFFGPLTVELQKRLQLLKRSSEDLLIMLNQLLSLSRIEVGGVELRIIEFRLGDFMEEVSAGVSALAQAKGLEFKWSVESDCSMRADPHAIKEILYNLLTNAIKYTERGVVSLRAALEPDGDQIRLEVTDTGRGIPEDELPFIFESFRQVGSPSAHRHGGVGLGLAIVKRLLELLGGQIEVKSALNEGSTFKVALPRVFKPQTK